MPQQPKFNPAMVTLAREARGLTQTELAGAVDVSQAMISMIEAGAKAPSTALLAELGRVLSFPVTFFNQMDPVMGPGLSEFFHRRRQDVGVKVLSKIHANVNIVRMHVARLLRSIDLPEQRIRPLDLEEFKSPSAVAQAVRAAWGLAPGPVPNVVKVIEDAGGIVIRMPFGTPRVDALSRWVPGLPPLFFVNEGMPTDRERLSLCHELGHLVMHDVPNGEMERQANEFAAEFLMPARDIAPHLDLVSIERLAALKPYWRVSMQALLYRATELKKVPPKKAQYLWIQMQPYRRQEPPELDLARETPGLLQEMIDLHREHFGFGLADLGLLLNAEASDLESFYGLSPTATEARSQMRIVNWGRTVQ